MVSVNNDIEALVNPKLFPQPCLRSLIFQQKGGVLSVECFTFSLVMLPSINEKHGKGLYVKHDYREREMMEVKRIIHQRDMVKWPAPQKTDRYGILYQFTFPTKLKRDLHNPLKATCDILGAGRYESVWRGKKKSRIWVDHAHLIQNDNRVLYEIPAKEVQPGPIQWGTIHLFRCPAGNYEDFLLRHCVNELARQLETTVPHFTITM